MSLLAKSIYQTLAFFDAQDFPLTLFEIRAYLVKPNPAPVSLKRTVRGSTHVSSFEGPRQLTGIQTTIETELQNLVAYQEGLYFLKDRESLVESRKRHYRISLERFRKAEKYLYFLRFFPFLRAVALSGSQAMLNSSEDSDIDLFLVTKKNRVWLTRLLVSFYFEILGQRRRGKQIASRFCLNHYVCEGLSIQDDRNLYTAMIYANLIPILGHQAFLKFWQNNLWIKSYFSSKQEFPSALLWNPLDFTLRDRPRGTAPSPSSESHEWPVGWEEGVLGGDREFSLLQKVFEFILDWTIAPLLNFLSGLYQKRRIKMQEYILVSDEELSFHPGSRGQKVLAKFRETVIRSGL